ncbi:mitochondrial import inner membrane translocase subunit Tim17 family protein [Purpureocillium lavendulum]|uniref:Mitochondrial import inner membrane translocase subunit Tim17 family protein n=1 Tax=Purpureocillium lavendulum TaxID=1247861 RepID=A0AB34FQC3_9HYPO|nr:mitochondrial import inner membrane translocase subunit Tim17 family protein [Purpureocillium lavendulum]
MSNDSSSPPHDDCRNTRGDPTTIPVFSPERVQSILDARRQHPTPFLSLFWLDPAKYYCAAITIGLEAFQTQVPSRALTSDEIGAVTDHIGTYVNTVLASRPVGMAVALFLAWRGRASFRFPFWQPKWVNTSPDVFPSIARPLLSGKTARFAWHSSRLVTYGVLCEGVVPFSVAVYAQVRCHSGISSDPRMQEAFRVSAPYIDPLKNIGKR